MNNLLPLLRAKSFTLTTAESCTGGMIAAAITDIPGASEMFDRGFVTYSNAAKQELLGVPPEIIQTHGAVSEECAAAMAEGALKNANADIALSVTGIAGPGGGSDEKPVGLVYIGISVRQKSLHGAKQVQRTCSPSDKVQTTHSRCFASVQSSGEMDHTHKACDDDIFKTEVIQCNFTGSRADIRQSTLIRALDLLTQTANAIER